MRIILLASIDEKLPTNLTGAADLIVRGTTVVKDHNDNQLAETIDALNVAYGLKERQG